jgi:hypothetical protein
MKAPPTVHEITKMLLHRDILKHLRERWQEQGKALESLKLHDLSSTTG